MYPHSYPFPSYQPSVGHLWINIWSRTFAKCRFCSLLRPASSAALRPFFCPKTGAPPDHFDHHFRGLLSSTIYMQHLITLVTESTQLQGLYRNPVYNPSHTYLRREETWVFPLLIWASCHISSDQQPAAVAEASVSAPCPLHGASLRLDSSRPGRTNRHGACMVTLKQKFWHKTMPLESS